MCMSAWISALFFKDARLFIIHQPQSSAGLRIEVRYRRRPYSSWLAAAKVLRILAACLS